VGYMHVENLYKNQMIMAFKRCYALEKIHGTSAHVAFKEGKLDLFSGGESEVRFAKLFDTVALIEKIKAMGPHCDIEGITIFGEAYGGSCQKMSGTYGKELKFIVFDVQIGKSWLSVPDMAEVAANLGLEVVHFEEGPTDLAWIDAQRDAPSVQAKRNGIVEAKPREGVVLRPPFEVITNSGERVISKHKGDSFNERATPQKVVDPEKLKVLEGAQAIAIEWVTEMRLEHVLQKFPAGTSVEKTKEVIAAMIEDVTREAKGEIVDSPDARKAIGKRTADLFKAREKNKLKELAG
jgi:hypothetical protein